MVAWKFEKFGGQMPIFDERLLPVDNAAYSENAYLQSGSLEPLAADISLWTLADPNARYVYRVPISNPGIDYMVNSYWLEFDDANTTCVRSTVMTTEGGRFYWANSTGPPGYTVKSRIIANAATPGSAPPLVLGIPRPEVAPGVTVSGGTTPTGTKAYVYTWVSAYSEEGQPSPPTVATGNQNGAWNLTFTAPTTADTTNRDLTATRIYRTETGADGSVAFFYVDQIPITQLTYSDTVAADIVVNQGIMQSDDWAGPPSDLRGIVSMPNGMMAGWTPYNEIWFAEPYQAHAWPVKYMLTVDAPIVGFGTIDQNLMILTTGQPYVATGVHPSVMTLRKVQPVEPCTAQGSIVSSPQGVIYTSYNGLILIGVAGGTNLTEHLIRKDQWLRLINLQTIHATFFMNGYYTYSAAIDGVFQTDTFEVADAFQTADYTGTMVGAHIALTDDRLGYTTLTCSSPTYNVMLDAWTGETMVIRAGQVFHVDRRQYVPRQSYIWRSKIMQLPYKQNLAAAKVFFEQPNGTPPDAEPTVFRMYVDDRLRYTYPLSVSGQQFRLPSGYYADSYQFELEGQMLIHNLQVASSARELRQV
jgi:hypothetical protein